MKSLELKSYPGEKFSDFCAAILVTAEILKSDRAFNPEHRGNITCIFKFNSDSRFCLWEIQKYKEVTYFIKKLRVCDMDAISPEELVTYESLAQEATGEHHNLVDSKR